MITIRISPETSTMVRPTLILTDSAIPRRLIAVTTSRKAMAIGTVGASMNSLK